MARVAVPSARAGGGKGPGRRRCPPGARRACRIPCNRTAMNWIHTQEKPQLVTHNDASFPTVRKKGGAAAAAADEKKKQRNERERNKKSSGMSDGVLPGQLVVIWWKRWWTKKNDDDCITAVARRYGNLISNSHRDSFRFLFYDLFFLDFFFVALHCHFFQTLSRLHCSTEKEQGPSSSSLWREEERKKLRFEDMVTPVFSMR